jgi:CheY-like chemotaxis protein
VGIPKQEQARVFEAFHQADSSNSRRHGGIGLGLSIVQELVTAIGGEISLESTESIGTRFTVLLPFESIADSLPWLSEISLNKPISVQIVATASGNVEVLRNYLLSAGYDVERSKDEASAFARMQSGRKVALILAAAESLESPAGFIAKIRDLNPEVSRVVLISTLTGYRLIPPATRDLFDGFLTLPISYTSLKSLASRTASPSAPARNDIAFEGKILVVDDNAVNRRIACALLTKLGISTETAENGFEALEKCRLGSYQLILMDCQMPVMDGFEATRSIREMVSGAKQLRIVGTSASTDAETDRLCRQAGMNSYLPKPITMASLEQMLKSTENVRID